MTSSSDVSAFPAVFAKAQAGPHTHAPAHSLAASIWAPKPPPREPGASQWPPSPGGGPFARPFDEDAVAFDRPARTNAFDLPALRTRTSTTFGSPLKKDVGVVGQGRRGASPQHETEQVESILRSLNLHSPGPAPQRAITSLHIDTTPDSSPSSDVSSLATPGDLSPARYGLGLGLGLGLKMDSSLGLDLHGQYAHPSEQARDRFMSNYVPSWDDQPLPYFPPPPVTSAFTRPAHGLQSQIHSSPLFDTFQDRPSPLSFGGHLPAVSGSPMGYSRSIGTSQGQSYNIPSSFNTTGPSYNEAPSYDTTPVYDLATAYDMATQYDTASSFDVNPPFERDRGLSSSGWATPRPTVQPGRWLYGAEERQVNEQRSPTFYTPPHARTTSNLSGVPSQPTSHDPINFLSLLHPSSTPPYHVFVGRIIKSSDQQASIFLQQKLKVADLEERGKIIEAICNRGFEMMSHRFGNWAVQRCLEAATTVEERRRIISCMRGRVVDLATNCYGCHVLQKALDCEEDIRLCIVSELLCGDPASTLVNKHASHVWSKVMELTWTPPAPPIFACINRSLHGQWAQLACHETGSLVVQHAFENLEDSAKAEIIDELLNRGSRVFGDIVKNQWGAYCIQHILEHGSPTHRQMVLDHIISDLLDYATNEQSFKSVTKAIKEGGQDLTNRFVKRMAEPAKGGRRAMIVDLALSTTGSQLIGVVLPTLNKEQRAVLYDSIRSHIVTLRGCKTGSKVIWLFDRMRAYYGY